jgi:hypothetical protein
MSRVLALIEGKSDVIDIDQATKIDRKAVISALKGVQAACRAVDDIVSGRLNKLSVRLRLDLLRKARMNPQPYNVFGNAALRRITHYQKNQLTASQLSI